MLLSGFHDFIDINNFWCLLMKNTEIQILDQQIIAYNTIVFCSYLGQHRFGHIYRNMAFNHLWNDPIFKVSLFFEIYLKFIPLLWIQRFVGSWIMFFTGGKRSSLLRGFICYLFLAAPAANMWAESGETCLLPPSSFFLTYLALAISRFIALVFCGDTVLRENHFSWFLMP